MKRCNGCGVEKEHADFNKRSASPDGLQHKCRQCNSEATKAWRRSNPEKARENSYRSTKKVLERNSNYYREFYAKQYATEEGRARWVKNVQNRRARLMSTEGEYTAEEFAELCLLYGGKCLSCGTTEERLTVDHVVPLSKGGSNYISNIQPLCLSCNSKKGSKTEDYRNNFAL